MYCVDTNRIHKPSVFKILFRVLSFYSIGRQTAVRKTTGGVRPLPKCYVTPPELASNQKESQKLPTVLANLRISVFKISLEKKKKGFLKERSQNILVSLVMTLTRNN